MPHHGMTPHISGTSLSAQARYAAGTREILECWFDGPADPRRVPDRRRRHAGRGGRPFLHSGRLIDILALAPPRLIPGKWGGNSQFSPTRLCFSAAERWRVAYCA